MTLTAPSPVIEIPDTPRIATHWTGAPADSPWIALARTLAPRLAERAASHDHDNTFVADGIALLREHGMMSLLVPTQLGGAGASHAEACAVLAELAPGCPATSLTLSMHSHLVGAQVWRHHRDLPAPVLPKVADTELVLVSTGASDWMSSTGTATEVEGGFRVSARKTPASGAPAGQVLVTSIRWDDAPDGPQVTTARSRSTPTASRSRRPGTRWACAARARTRWCWTTSSCRVPRSRSSVLPTCGTRCGAW